MDTFYYIAKVISSCKTYALSTFGKKGQMKKLEQELQGEE